MSKIAETAHTILPLIAERWSPRAFDSEPLEAFAFAASWPQKG